LSINSGVLENWFFVISINDVTWHTNGPFFSVGHSVLSILLFLDSFGGISEGFTISFSLCWGFFSGGIISGGWGFDLWFDGVFLGGL